MTAFYNEIDPFAAAWLRQLIAYGHIAPGIVDERSIEDIRPDELTGFTQVHFFAGIGVWSYALRLAGWPDDRPIWTASCPCQPFSAAGKGGGFDDERHLWPALYWHISQCKPEIIIGEQVASKDGLAWWQLVSSDLEIAGYANAAVDFCAASVGAPHIRQRLYWMAHADGEAGSGRRIQRPGQGNGAGIGSTRERLTGLRTDDRMADSDGTRLLSAAHGRICGSEESAGSWNGESVRSCDAVGMADSDDTIRRADLSGRHDGNGSDAGWSQSPGHTGTGSADGGMGNPNGDGTGWNSRTIPRPEATGSRGRETNGNIGDSLDMASRPDGMADAAGIAGSEVTTGNDTVDEQWSAVGRWTEQSAGPGTDGGIVHGDHSAGRGEVGSSGDVAGMEWTSPTNGFWRDADWLFCRDGKWRPVEPSSQPMADGPSIGMGRLRDHGASADADQEPQAQIIRPFPLAKNQVARTGRLRGYGNAIVGPQAAVFIEAVREIIDG